MEKKNNDSIFDDKIDEWHKSDSSLNLWEYLGLTEEQFKIWLKTPEMIEKEHNNEKIWKEKIKKN